MKKIPSLDLGPEISLLWDELNQAFQSVLKHRRFIMGPEVMEFEEAAAEYLGCRYAIGMNSGTDALTIGLKALGVGPGDEVITTSFSFFATAESISLLGAQPVFVDIDPVTYNIDPQKIEAVITDRSKVILPVHLYGHAAEMATIMKIARSHGLRVLEDAAQGFGAKYGSDKLGTIGDVGAFSFFPSKNLGAFGDAGLLVTNDPDLAELAGMLRKHGAKRKYENEMVGYNSRLDTIQAAILNIKLPHIDEFHIGRRKVANRYNQLFENVPGMVLPEEVSPAYHVFHQYTIRLPDVDRDSIKKSLADQGISTMVYYPIPIHRLKVYRDLGYELPESERAAREVISLPIWPQIEFEIQEFVSDNIKNILAAQK